MEFTDINSMGERGELLGRIDRQNSRFRTARTIIIKFGLHAYFVELESAKNVLNERVLAIDLEILHHDKVTSTTPDLVHPLHTSTLHQLNGMNRID
ncbi:hypothetical protein TNCV_5059381 [Trichonephila clavipes]|nr:hypothetical protein TNCV_5059381 [Trichonephila clavipes]